MHQVILLMRNAGIVENEIGKGRQRMTDRAIARTGAGCFARSVFAREKNLQPLEFRRTEPKFLSVSLEMAVAGISNVLRMGQTIEQLKQVLRVLERGFPHAGQLWQLIPDEKEIER